MKPEDIKLLEACLEAPFQLSLQTFVILAGKRPGKKSPKQFVQRFDLYNYYANLNVKHRNNILYIF